MVFSVPKKLECERFQSHYKSLVLITRRYWLKTQVCPSPVHLRTSEVKQSTYTLLEREFI